MFAPFCYVWCLVKFDNFAILWYNNNIKNKMEVFMSENKVILYTIGCVKCTQLEKRLDQRNIKYDICTDINVMKSLGIKSAPYRQVLKSNLKQL